MELIGMVESLSFVPIQGLNDDLLLPWLDLYETAFPPNEKILVSVILGFLRDPNKAKAEGINITGILDSSAHFIAMAMYQLPPDKPVAVLWYVAVLADQRSKGWGSEIYKSLLSQIDPGKYQALVFEVEIPDEAASSPDAERRIRFYQKNGASLLTGIHYLQSVGWHQPPTPMHIMIHPLHPMDAEIAYGLAHSIFEDAMHKTGSLALE
jgi:hypothetical protein